MRIVSFTEARNGLKSVLDGVVNDADCTVITRRDSEDAVVMSMDYYNSLMETIYLSRSPANAAHLNKSIAQYNAGQVTERGLLE
ncbi:MULTISPECIES: type II toxin-antitoxin system Phd/YefM family antitoxin [Photobacterium]|uniref:Antitoxin n=1 Tax=Photobacterium carnosum TaxID=2023717 RepID=A0A2N4USB2_9GAMM|nr:MULTISPECIES: type II toxin-antitoxin system prevent-host-death family antitoxin [Photobacterium]MCD9531774.1 type II toxin-antitoxin system prevent-host-death family antitoxin [Photobacterium carnosum]MCD9539606.1 type II toxin-antitoxin system prevent-host-death family antitoxin [Photobacterium carnosum]MCD9552451.1 type II toxin-antitoxin system prevent-host-death family antitoxin [Photobacterium carnosum]MCF2155705.1 type II toxin-antitoxin system prevent-host-death family antitoxin [Pho